MDEAWTLDFLILMTCVIVFICRNQEIYVRSTGRDRALMSALSFLAGLYPVDDLRTNWNQEIAWQPAPVHSQTMIDDWIMRAKKICPKTYDS